MAQPKETGESGGVEPCDNEEGNGIEVSVPALVVCFRDSLAHESQYSYCRLRVQDDAARQVERCESHPFFLLLQQIFAKHVVAVWFP